jgi:hypothetical protein
MSWTGTDSRNDDRGCRPIRRPRERTRKAICAARLSCRSGLDARSQMSACISQPVAQTARLHKGWPSAWDHGLCRRISFPRSVDQPLLLPVDMREWLPEDDLVFIVLDAVAALDLGGFRRWYRADGHGRADPGSEPAPHGRGVDAGHGRHDPVQSAVYGPSGVEPAAHRHRARRSRRHQPRAQDGAAVEPARRVGHLRQARAPGAGHRGRLRRRPRHQRPRPGTRR